MYATYKSGTVPVYRYYNNFDHDHVYTTNYHKWGKGGSYRTPDGEHGYTYEGVAFYIYKYPRAGLKPIVVAPAFGGQLLGGCRVLVPDLGQHVVELPAHLDGFVQRPAAFRQLGRRVLVHGVPAVGV